MPIMFVDMIRIWLLFSIVEPNRKVCMKDLKITADGDQDINVYRVQKV